MFKKYKNCVFIRKKVTMDFFQLILILKSFSNSSSGASDKYYRLQIIRCIFLKQAQ